MTGGENNKGTYLSLYGLNLGSFAAYGVTSFVSIGGVRVDNYRCLEPVKAQHMAALGVKRLTVQVGSLVGLTPGVAYPVSVSVAGQTPSNAMSGAAYVTLDGDPLTFTPQPGTILFVDPVNGSDSAAGTFSAPLRNLQSTSGTAGALRINTGANGTDGTKPGTHVILRGGTYTAVGLNSRWVDLFRITGTAPTGALDRGPIVVTSYPGAAGANTPETVLWQGAAGQGGGFNGNDSTRANETSTSFGGFTGWCQYIHISNLKVAVSAGTGGDGGPFNTQNSGRFWRITNCEATWPSTVTGANHGRSAGIEGSPRDGRFVLNSLHDINGDASANENHGIYLDGHSSGASNVAANCVFAYNFIKDIGAGNGVQFYDGVNGAGMSGHRLHHNWIQNTNKHGLNIADNTRGVVAWNNVIVSAGEAGLRISTSAVTATNGVVFTNNSVFGWGRVQANRAAVADEANLGSGTARVENNIFMQSPGHAANGYDFTVENSGRVAFVKNRWFDPDGRVTTKPTSDATGSWGDPLFTAPASGDFSLASGSPCLNAGNSPTGVTRLDGYRLNAAPQGAAHDQGAEER